MRLDIPFRSIVKSSNFTFVIGLKSKEFTVHEQAICSLSPSLELVCRRADVVGEQPIIFWYDIDEETFVRFCQFAYTGDYDDPICGEDFDLLDEPAAPVADPTPELDRWNVPIMKKKKKKTKKSWAFGNAPLDYPPDDLPQPPVDDHDPPAAPVHWEEGSVDDALPPDEAPTVYAVEEAPPEVAAPEAPMEEHPEDDLDSWGVFRSDKKSKKKTKNASRVYEIEDTDSLVIERAPDHFSSWDKPFEPSVPDPEPPTPPVQRSTFETLTYILKEPRAETNGIPEDSDPSQSHTSVFLGHARLYSLGAKYKVESLMVLALRKLHSTLNSFDMLPHRAEDIVRLTRYAYDKKNSENETGRLRELVLLYVVARRNEITTTDEFLALLEEGGQFVRDFWLEANGRFFGCDGD